jgi:2'-5' RNA ligase
MRIFSAVDLPKEIKENAIKIEEELKKLREKLTFVNADAMHITLNFFGEVDKKTSEKIKDSIKFVSFSSFEIELEGLSYFSPESVRVLFISIKKGNKELVNLSKNIEESIIENRIEINYEKITKDFIPHLTVARVKFLKDKELLLSTIKEYSNKNFGSFSVDEIKLKESVLTAKGRVYSNI